MQAPCLRPESARLFFGKGPFCEPSSAFGHDGVGLSQGRIDGQHCSGMVPHFFNRGHPQT